MIRSKEIKQVLIFAAGRGSRMAPITDNMPKPLIEVKNSSMLLHIINKLSKISSIERIIINGYYLVERLDEFVNNLQNDKIILSKEVEKLETGGGVLYAKDLIDLASPILAINGDLYWEGGVDDINLMCENWAKSSCDFLLGLKEKELYFGYDGAGDFSLVGNRIAMAEPLKYAYLGIQIFDPKIVINNAPDKCFSISYFFRDKNLNIEGLVLKNDYFHVGTPEALEYVNKNK